MILIALVKLYEVATPTPYAHNQIAVQLWVSLRLEQLLAIERIELQLMTTQTDV